MLVALHWLNPRQGNRAIVRSQTNKYQTAHYQYTYFTIYIYTRKYQYKYHDQITIYNNIIETKTIFSSHVQGSQLLSELGYTRENVWNLSDTPRSLTSLTNGIVDLMSTSVCKLLSLKPNPQVVSAAVGTKNCRMVHESIPLQKETKGNYKIT